MSKVYELGYNNAIYCPGSSFEAWLQHEITKL